MSNIMNKLISIRTKPIQASAGSRLTPKIKIAISVIAMLFLLAVMLSLIALMVGLIVLMWFVLPWYIALPITIVLLL
jgi:hypothetical protein